ncbi:uncharacterized protein LOC141725802 isoform X1 [Zonotrichia albicollis]|uniref:uncharacterized protein LOC141725802 isoform X1 n=2 Tax=Zonotrichia albicollis TaxID=44394 RepID=UPI003D80FCB3
MEAKELFLALLQPQVTVVATLGELLDTLPTRDEMPLRSLEYLHLKLVDFSGKLSGTMKCNDDTWWHCDVTSNNEAPPASLSQALAAYDNTPWTTWLHVKMEAWHMLGSADKRLENWAELARAAPVLLSICRDLAAEVTSLEATAWAREQPDENAWFWAAQKNMVELGQARGKDEEAEVLATWEAQVREQAMVAASVATRATKVRERVEEALGLLERLVAACDEATVFPRELLRLLRDIEATLEGTNEASPDVPEGLVAKVAVVERLWEANARLAKDHLLGALQDIKFYFTIGPDRHNACGVAERCQRAIEDIPRLLQPPERPQTIPRVSQLSPALLQPQVTVVATLGELLDTLPRWDEMPLKSLEYLHLKLVHFCRKLGGTTEFIDDTWWHRDVTSNNEARPTSLSRALAAYENTPWTTWDCVKMEAWHWLGSLDKCLENSAELGRKATELLNICRDLATEAATKAATATAWARELLALAARYGTAQENMVELGQALGREEGAEVVARYEAQVRREARVAASEATRATMVRQRLEAALGQLERLVAACDEAATFPQELQRRVGDIVATLEGTNEASPNVPEDLVANVAEAERLWEANARLAKDHLRGVVQDITKFYFTGGCTSPSTRGVAERCQRAIEDIPRLLRPPECPQSVPKVFLMSTELQKLSLTLLKHNVAKPFWHRY